LEYLTTRVFIMVLLAGHDTLVVSHQTN